TGMAKRMTPNVPERTAGHSLPGSQATRLRSRSFRGRLPHHCPGVSPLKREGQPAISLLDLVHAVVQRDNFARMHLNGTRVSAIQVVRVVCQDDQLGPPCHSVIAAE